MIFGPPNDFREKSNSYRAVGELRRLIFSGELSPGSDHLETELAERLGMSRTPVREAALMLEAQGLVEVRPRRGMRILPVSPEDMQEIYDILTELEALAAANAAKAAQENRDLTALERSISDMEKALEADDRQAWADADERFHAALVHLGGNGRIEAITAMMADQVRRARAMTLYMRPAPVKSHEDHCGVLEAIRAGDAEAAHRIHHAHRKEAGALLIGLLRRHRFHQL
ncbi:GntR family transcriptional regulator [uncultured Roseobacter sp.]|uniref:GntR family transcriptional regulator n=1 Tax=uncultured Roseobacter sp. TaxID=114847 RepID=UPI0026277FFB|nr:GntR family transcriptional regulator [uncultured Roseobacter sp.]